LSVEFTELNGDLDAEYQWTFGNGATSNEPVITEYEFTNAGVYDISLKITDSKGCVNIQNQSALIEAYELPIANFSFSPGFASNIEPEIQFSNASSENATSWNWDFGDNDFSSQENPIHEYSFPSLYEVKLFASTADGCVDSTSKIVKYKEVIQIYIPNVFTPNYDGTNDFFELFAKGRIDEFSIKIFDRWGGQIFYTDNIENSWDGKNKTGKEVQVGVYTYLIEYGAYDPVFEEAISKQISGTITILR
jgi:gliding motility-associated-like protein